MSSLQIKEWIEKIVAGQTTALARAITLVESHKHEDWQKAKEMITQLAKPEKKVRRLGFSGPPGVGKSTLIEKMGLEIVNRGERVAVLAVDPSSVMSGGSILGDKTRMEELSRNAKAFVRPSPTRGHLGGVTSRLPGVILLCEAAGFDWVLVESVGVGQSEIELRHMVDHFTLIAQPGSGDELQGIKKGILEYVDLILVNKVDRDPKLVNLTKQQLLSAIKILHTKNVDLISTSGLTGEGVKDFFDAVDDFFRKFNFQDRSAFHVNWFESLVFSEFRNRIKYQEDLESLFQSFSKKVSNNKLNSIEAVDEFFRAIGIEN